MNAIAAVCKNRGIGMNNELLFNIPEDKKYFRSMTKGKTVIMGRKTFQSLPDGKPLSDRRNIVFSNDDGFSPAGCEVCHSIADLDKLLESTAPEDVFVIGGGEIYSLLLEKCNKAYITLVEAQAEADRFFPDIENTGEWELVSSSEEKKYEDLVFRFLVFQRIE